MDLTGKSGYNLTHSKNEANVVTLTLKDTSDTSTLLEIVIEANKLPAFAKSLEELSRQVSDQVQNQQRWRSIYDKNNSSAEVRFNI